MEKKHLPFMGAGPLIVAPQLVITAMVLVLSKRGYFHMGKIFESPLPCRVISTVIIIFGIYMWISATFKARIDKNIEVNHLVTTGIYGIVRNPIYSAFFLICIGTLLMEGKLLLLIFPVIYWAYMTVFLKLTEERWLTVLYGEEYIDYCKRVNRCIPWFARAR